MQSRTAILAIAALGLMTTAASAEVITYGFENISHNDPMDELIGETQLFVDVSDDVPGVAFTFRNEGPEASVIASIYFDDGTLLGISSISDDPPDVEFMPGGSPPDLPAGEEIDPPFEVSAGFHASAIPAPPMTGVGPYESVTIMFDLIAGGTYLDVIDELNDGTLRVGIHVIGYDSEGSESFVHVPEPATAGLLGLAAAVLLLRRRRPA